MEAERMNRRIVLLTGAGASQPLGLPLMKTFVSEELLFSGSDLAQLVASLALSWARANTREIDFEYIYSLAHLLSHVEPRDPLAYPFLADPRAKFFWRVGSAQKERTASLALSWAQANTKEIDFEYIYSLAHLLSHVERRDPLAYPFLADPRATFSWRVGSSTKNRAASLDDARTGATELREKLREHVHNSLRDPDRKKAATIYGDLLRPLMERLGNATSLDMFTTNYDRAVEVIWEDGLQESAFGRTTVLVNGFRLLNPNRPSKEWAPASYDDAADHDAFTVRLHKLHGSLNWRRLGSGVLVETSADDYSPRGESALIYPLQVKSDHLGDPFATLFNRWRKAVSTATDCIAIGASLRDPEILEPLVRRLAESTGFRLWIADPNAEGLQKRFGDVSSKVIAIASRIDDAGLGDELVKRIFESETETGDELRPTTVAG
jgi:hypothetical protein